MEYDYEWKVDEHQQIEVQGQEYKDEEEKEDGGGESKEEK